MCEGITHHVINGNDVILNAGELLFLSLSAKQKIYPVSTDLAKKTKLFGLFLLRRVTNVTDWRCFQVP